MNFKSNPPSVLARFARYRGRIAVLLGLLSCSDAIWAADLWPDMPAPPKASVQWVAENMRVNGIPTRIMQFQSKASRSVVTEFYKSFWAGYEHKPSVHALGDATVINEGVGPYLMTVKVQDSADGESHGLLSVARVLGSKPDHDPGVVALMPGAQVASVVESYDAGKRSRQVVILAPQAPASVSEFYQASFTNSGWTQLQGGENSDTARASDPSFLVFSQGSQEMMVSITPSKNRNGSTVLTNLVTKDTGTSSN